MIIRDDHPVVIPAVLATRAELAAGVQDIEHLCYHAANEYLRRRHAHLTPDVYDDLVSFLMLAAWTEARKYRPLGGTSSLTGFLSARLAYRCTDWYRSRFGRGRRERPVILSLDGLSHDVPAPEAA